jgi:hypothetical protein
MTPIQFILNAFYVGICALAVVFLLRLGIFLMRLEIFLEPVIVEWVCRFMGHPELAQHWQPSDGTWFGIALETIHNGFAVIVVLISAIQDIIKVFGWH